MNNNDQINSIRSVAGTALNGFPPSKPAADKNDDMQNDDMCRSGGQRSMLNGGGQRTWKYATGEGM